MAVQCSAIDMMHSVTGPVKIALGIFEALRFRSSAAEAQQVVVRAVSWEGLP